MPVKTTRIARREGRGLRMGNVIIVFQFKIPGKPRAGLPHAHAYAVAHQQ
jgi:hypothetical protein